MDSQQKAYIYGLATVLLWSTVATAFKVSLRYIGPTGLLLYACLTSIIILGLILLLQGRLSVIFSYTRTQYARSLGLGILNPFLYYLILFKAYELLPAQVAQPLNYTWALTLAFLSVPLLGQTIGLSEFIAGLVCYCGVVVISSQGTFVRFSSFDPLGVGLALASTVVWSLSWISSTKDDRDPVAGLLLSFLCGLPFILITALFTGGLHPPDIRGLLGAVYVGTFEMGITFVLWLKALKLSKNTARVGNLIFLSPFLSLVFIHAIAEEEIYASTYIGLALIIAGLVIQRTRPRRTGV